MTSHPFLDDLHSRLDAWHLLKHDFYQQWTAGTLPKDVLGVYAREYYRHVAAFPRYISGLHRLCPSLPQRQVLLENLVEEEQGDTNHPELWLRFAEALGVPREDCSRDAALPETRALEEGYFTLTASDYATGLGALYAYERQTPEVSASKIEGLVTHYNITDDQALAFFEVHKGADVWHREAVAGLLEALDPAGQKRAAEGAEQGARLLWQFLDGMMSSMPAHAC